MPERMLLSHPVWTADVADHNRRSVADVLRILRLLPPKVCSATPQLCCVAASAWIVSGGCGHPSDLLTARSSGV